MTDEATDGPLSPEAALRLIDQVRRMGIESAAEVIRRFTTLAGAVPRTAPGNGAPGPGVTLVPGGPDVVRAQTARAVEAYAEFTRELYEAVMAIADVTGVDRAGEPVTLPPIGPGGSASATLWVHAVGSGFEEIDLDAGPLFGSAGVLTGAVVRLSPSHLRVGPGQAGRVTVAVDVPVGAPAGSYRGHVVARGDPEVWAVIVVPVADA